QPGGALIDCLRWWRRGRPCMRGDGRTTVSYIASMLERASEWGAPRLEPTSTPQGEFSERVAEYAHRAPTKCRAESERPARSEPAGAVAIVFLRTLGRALIRKACAVTLAPVGVSLERRRIFLRFRTIVFAAFVVVLPLLVG